MGPKKKETKLPAVGRGKPEAAPKGRMSSSKAGAASSNRGRGGSSALPKIEKGSRADTKAQKASDDAQKNAAKEKEAMYTEMGKMAVEEKIKREYDAEMAVIEAEQARLAAEAEAKRLKEEAERAAEELRIRSNGMVKLLYEQYDEEFEIVDGSTTQENIDEVYCLSFVMPGCIVHLSLLSPQEMREKEAAGETQYEHYLKEEPPGTYRHMCKDTNYYVYVIQDAEQLKRDQEEMAKVASTMDAAPSNSGGENIERNDGRGFESCSCIYGNPCLDEYGCKDWDNRFAVSKKNGWKGF